MRFTQVSYQKTFNLGSYQSERIGVELELSEGESPKEALDTAKQLVEEYHKENNKGLVLSEILPISTSNIHDDEKGVKFTQPPPSKQSISEQITSCTDIKILESYKLIVKKNPELQNVYNETMDYLTQKF